MVGQAAIVGKTGHASDQRARAASARSSMTSAMAVAQRRACSNVRSENGATWPGRWQVAQRLCRIAATSLA